MTETTLNPIAVLNDAFRTSLQGGIVVLTAGILTFSQEEQAAILAAVRNFDSFPVENDPYGEHDFGSIDFQNAQIFFKIDYYDLNLEYGSENPADPNQTKRVMTVMLAAEY